MVEAFKNPLIERLNMNTSSASITKRSDTDVCDDRRQHRNVMKEKK
jgi:hypothetical protein